MEPPEADWRRDVVFFFSSRRRHTRLQGDWSSDVCSSDLADVRRALTGETFSSTVEIFGVVFEAWYSPVRDVDGRVAGVIGVGTDVSERCQIGRASCRERV